MTTLKRHFLGWEQPFLLTAAKWLQKHHVRDTLGHANHLLVLVTGQAVGRRLQALMVHEAAKNNRAVELPQIQTTNQWVDRLIGNAHLIADATTSLIATATVLRSLPRQETVSIVGSRPPKNEDFTGWCTVSTQLGEVFSTLSGCGLSPDRTTWPEQAQLLLTETAEARFDVLYNIQLQVQSLLQEEGKHLIEIKRLELLTQEQPIDVGSLTHVVLVGTSDLNGFAMKIVDYLCASGIAIESLIRAPDSESSGFDEYGCVEIEHWMETTIEIPDESIKVAGSPSGQAAEVIRVLESLQDIATTDQVTIASTDEAVIPIIQRHLTGYGLKSRYAGGKPVLQSPEALILKVIAEFLRTRTYASYASFVRHPDVAALLNVRETVLIALDTYSMDFVPTHVHAKGWFIPNRELSTMKELVDLHTRVFRLLQSSIRCEEHPSSVVHCSATIRNFLLEVYGDETLDRQHPKLISLQHIFSILDSLDAISASIQDRLGTVQMSDVIRLVLTRVETASIPEYPDPMAIETVGWLEGMVVDSPYLLVVGMNADLVGGSNPGDAFFPDRLRSALGLETIDRRMARDAHAMTAMQQSRLSDGRLVWIVARKNTEGDPLTPSPLLLRCRTSEQLARRATDLVVSFDRETPEVPPQFVQSKIGSGIPIPKPCDFKTEPLKKLSVTAFRDYISCPYRFWLKHVLHLHVERAGEMELDARLFGSLVHKVLEQFGKDSSVNKSSEADAIQQVLSDVLDDVVQLKFGNNCSGMIDVQVELARFRLRQFSIHQAQVVFDGWSIVCTEKRIRKKLDVEGKPFTISGTIDRIDIHTDGRIRILDYKTGSTTANSIHFKKSDGQWIDLQLPLYRELLSEISELQECDTSDDNVSLGYFVIGDQDSSVGIDLLDLPDDVMLTAHDTTRSIIRSIQLGEFGEAPSDPAPPFYNDFSWICQDSNIVEDTKGEGDA